MTAYADLADLPEDDRIAIIGKAAENGALVGVFVDDDDKADRYVAKLTQRFKVKVVDRKAGLVAGTVLVRIGSNRRPFTGDCDAGAVRVPETTRLRNGRQPGETGLVHLLKQPKPGPPTHGQRPDAVQITQHLKEVRRALRDGGSTAWPHLPGALSATGGALR